FDNYALSQLSRIGALSLLALSVALLTGAAGLPSLGQVAPFAVGAYVTYRLAEAEIVVGPVQVAVSALAATAFSAAVGALIIRARGVVFLMVTLAVGVLTSQAAGQWKEATGGTDGTGYITASLPYWGADPLVDDAHVYWYVLAVSAVVVLATAAALRSAPGTLLRGVRDNELRMRAGGHRVAGYLLLAYIGAGAIAGVGGSLYATSQRFVSPSEVGFSLAAMMLVAVLIGGVHSITGALFGVFVVTAVRFWIAPEGYSDLWLGLLFMTCVYVLPDGVVGGLASIRRRLAKLHVTARFKSPRIHN
ncbi:MAG: branched-chain amino acid ABC transporter permease, partial [Stackebrandtia sp.]